jgi:hypothetical protein
MVPLISQTNPDIDKDNLILTIEHERQIEFFTEWGHRWFDLKRTGRADKVLGGMEGYTSDAKLYPIPQSEIEKAPFLGKQNDGY